MLTHPRFACPSLPPQREPGGGQCLPVLLLMPNDAHRKLPPPLRQRVGALKSVQRISVEEEVGDALRVSICNIDEITIVSDACIEPIDLPNLLQTTNKASSATTATLPLTIELLRIRL